MTEKEKILFYRREETHGYLSNFWRRPQIIDGKVYPTNEHYYQSKKAKNHVIEEWIAAAPTAWLAMKAGRALRDKNLRENWEEEKTKVMLKGLRAKFSQNIELAKKLLGTGDRIIGENSPDDMFWGIRGKNVLGKLLMKVRAELEEDALKDRIWYCPLCHYVWFDNALGPFGWGLYAIKKCPKCGNKEYSSFSIVDISDSKSPYYSRIRYNFLEAEG